MKLYFFHTFIFNCLILPFLYYIHDILLYVMLFIISVSYIQVVLTFTYNFFHTIYMLYILYFVVCNISYILFCILLQL